MFGHRLPRLAATNRDGDPVLSREPSPRATTQGEADGFPPPAVAPRRLQPRGAARRRLRIVRRSRRVVAVRTPPKPPRRRRRQPTPAAGEPSAGAEQPTSGRIELADAGYALTLADNWFRVDLDDEGVQDVLDAGADELPKDSVRR